MIDVSVHFICFIHVEPFTCVTRLYPIFGRKKTYGPRCK